MVHFLNLHQSLPQWSTLLYGAPLLGKIHVYISNIRLAKKIFVLDKCSSLLCLAGEKSFIGFSFWNIVEKCFELLVHFLNLRWSLPQWSTLLYGAPLLGKIHVYIANIRLAKKNFVLDKCSSLLCLAGEKSFMGFSFWNIVEKLFVLLVHFSNLQKNICFCNKN